MAKITITEALAEIKTIGKRIEKKQEFIKSALYRQDFVKDPLEKDGGSFQAIKRERQAIGDLQTRVVAIRTGIINANMTTAINIGTQTKTIEEWLVWRRDVAPKHKDFLAQIRAGLNNMRQQVQKQGLNVVSGGTAATPQDVVVNVNEQELATEIEDMETILGTLDGQLSLKNATVMIDV